MTSVPETRYAKAAEGRHLAYQVVGEGTTDLIYVPDWWNHIEAQWEEPALERFLHRLASFSRLILFDKRGMGASDPVSQNETANVGGLDRGRPGGHGSDRLSTSRRVRKQRRWTDGSPLRGDVPATDVGVDSGQHSCSHYRS